ncbi:MAG: efflux system, outer rane lipoprotein NodT family [Rhodocyclales bacterium]|nr:efflux system, outer rane lipoprotein NodT family [Rhodocyclales bacterium]
MSLRSLPHLHKSMLLLVMLPWLAACVSSAGIATQQHPLQPGQQVLASMPLASPSERWWEIFGDPQLNELVIAALRDNPSLAVAQARAERADIIINAAHAAYGPSVSLDINPTQQRFPENYIIPPQLAGKVRTSNRAALDFSGEIDFWGKHRAALEGAVAQDKLALAEYQSARLMISAALVRSWGELDRITRQHQLVEDQLVIRNQSLGLLQKREKAGFEPGVDRAQTEGAMAALRGELRSLEERGQVQRHLIAVLAGREPGEGEKLTAPHMREVPAALPTQVPAELLARRPDVAASRWRVEAATQDAAVARANFYPNVNITGFVGFQALGLDKWLDFGSRTYSIGPIISLPVFDAGRLRATYGVKTADVDAAVAQYNQTLLDGLREIVDELTQLQGTSAAQTEQQTVLDKSREVERILTQRESKGLINHLPVLNASVQRMAAERGMADLAARRFDTTVQLIRATGGDGAAALPGLLPDTQIHTETHTEIHTAANKDHS